MPRTADDRSPGAAPRHPLVLSDKLLDWLYLILAILFETAGTTALKLSEGFTRLVPSLLMVLCYAVSFGMFALALKRIDVGVGYAIWAGLGAALIAAIGVVVFKEQLPVPKLLSLALIIGGVVGLNLSGTY